MEVHSDLKTLLSELKLAITNWSELAAMADDYCLGTKTSTRSASIALASASSPGLSAGLRKVNLTRKR
jgi:hypothetical protein